MDSGIAGCGGEEGPKAESINTTGECHDQCVMAVSSRVGYKWLYRHYVCHPWHKQTYLFEISSDMSPLTLTRALQCAPYPSARFTGCHLSFLNIDRHPAYLSEELASVDHCGSIREVLFSGDRGFDPRGRCLSQWFPTWAHTPQRGSLIFNGGNLRMSY